MQLSILLNKLQGFSSTSFMSIKRLFDVLLSLVGLIFLTPVFIIISMLIASDSRGDVFFRQQRVGKNGKNFLIWKFRTMKLNSEQHGLLSVGSRDQRITRIGYYLRKYKVDELPQLINVFMGEMSIVGPRPEVRKFVDLYTPEQIQVLSVKPGITDYASIKYSNENELLSESKNPEEFYISHVMPAKLALNLKYIQERNLATDVKIIFNTIFRILGIR